MKRFSPFLVSCLWGASWGAILGAVRTHRAALHLLAKGRALEPLGIPSLPGPSHWGVLESLAPAGAGALFFGLSVGLGSGALASLWVELGGRTGLAGRKARWLCLIAPLWALGAGDAGLSVTLLAIVVGTCLFPVPEENPRTLLIAACACLAAAGLLPWAHAQEGPFSRLRDRVLLSTAGGLAVNDFYYRWTLYPAEAIKPLNQRSQPTAALLGPPSSSEGDRFRDEVSTFGVLCLPGASPGADFAVGWGPAGPFLSAEGSRAPWPSDRNSQEAAWRRFCNLTDHSGPLRRVTAFSLFTACPVGLAWALGSLCLWLGRRTFPRHPEASALALAFLLAAVVATAGRPSLPLGPQGAQRTYPVPESTHPADRLRATRAAPTLGQRAVPILLRALADPVVNVRYAAAEALGATGGEGVQARLLEVLRGSDEWYVKERAYAALWRLGWRPQS